MIGLSLSNCVLDIVAGKVDIQNVDKIIARTCCKSKENWDSLINSYVGSHWRGYEKDAERIVRILLDNKKIVQPRIDGGKSPSIDNGYWVATEDEIQ